MKTIFKKNGGFTLVELIVVIAILAILAAVAIPAYSGYIEKANRAGDETLLAAVNKAFASACLENGTDVHLIKGANIVWGEEDSDGNKPIVGAYVTKPNDDVDKAFRRFFQGNEKTAFKVMEKIGFAKELGAFVDADTYEGTLTALYGGGILTLNTNSVNALVNSKLGAFGANKLMDETTSALDYAYQAGVLDNIGDPFVAALGGYMGLEEGEDALAAVEKMFTDESGNVDWDAYDEYVTNAVVLYAADNSSGLTTESVGKWLGGGSDMDDMKGQANATTLSEAAAIYGLYMSWKGEDFDEEQGTGMHMIDAMNNQEFANWVATSPDAQTELNAYKGAMDIISSSAQDSSAANTLLSNGYSDPELMDIIAGIIGE